jgi:hypothetical protein
MTDTCKNCGVSLPARRPLKTFCNYACRGQFKAREAANYRTGKIGGRTDNKNNALHDLKMASRGQLTFERINSVTIRVDSRNKRSIAWLMEVAWPGGARQRWVARVGRSASEPMTLDTAKREVDLMLRDRARGESPADLDLIAAYEVDRAERRKAIKRPPTDLMGAKTWRHTPIDSALRKAILEAEVGIKLPTLELVVSNPHKTPEAEAA